MLKQLFAYEKLVNRDQEMGSQFLGKNFWVKLVIFYIALVVIVPIVLIISGVNLGALGVVIFLSMFMTLLYCNTMRWSDLRSYPVSDTLITAIPVFLYPAFFLLAFLILIMVGLTGLYFSYGESVAFILQGVDPTEILTMVFLFLALWFFNSVGAFFGKWWIRAVWYGGSTMLILGVMIFTATRIKANGYYGMVGIHDIISFYPGVGGMIGSALLAVGCGVFAFRYGTYLLRHDLSGQHAGKKGTGRGNGVGQGEKAQSGMFRKKLFREKGWIGLILMFAVLGAVLIPFVLLFQKGDNWKTVNVVYDSVSDYEKWDTLQDDVGLAEDLRYTNMTNLIFPENPREEDVQYYHAGLEGSFEWGEDGGISELSYHRILVQQLSDENYSKEKERVANLTYTYQGTGQVSDPVNYVRKDTEHFPAEAYLAVFDFTSECYEYALFDDEKNQVIYLFGDSAKLCDYAEDYAITPRCFDPVVTVRDANSDDVSFSIYSFYDEELGWYE